MHRSVLTSTLAAAMIAALPVTQSFADGGGVVAARSVSAMIAKQEAWNVLAHRVAYAPPAAAITRSAENRKVQVALNYFGFRAGQPDGMLGPASRSAIATYQTHMGYAATGRLTRRGRDFLLDSHKRALAGGRALNRLLAANPAGARGLLIAYRDGFPGVSTPQVAAAPRTSVRPKPRQPQPRLPEPTESVAPAETPATPLAPRPDRAPAAIHPMQLMASVPTG